MWEPFDLQHVNVNGFHTIRRIFVCSKRWHSTAIAAETTTPQPQFNSIRSIINKQIMSKYKSKYVHNYNKHKHYVIIVIYF